MLVEVMVKFKVEDGNIMHIFSLVNIKSSGIRIRMWLEKLLALLNEERKTNCQSLCDKEDYMLSVASIERVFHPFLEKIIFRRTETWQTLYLEVCMFWIIIDTIFIFAGVQKTRRCTAV